MMKKIKNMSFMRKLVHYLTHGISEYNIGRANCLA